ncbi:hypothetical protein CRG98_012525 [Punica granatum]|uniref:Uncharacterized protein n=1 Tax=Punica granatum TaxID=22663 RepID=A0A2I0KF19_PUNGR|nr:hypothetical protein CRG98_012525 [Punica granatum]
MVVRDGPRFVGRQFLTIRLWEPCFQPAEATHSEVAVWVRLLELPMEFYSERVLRKVGDQIGPLLRIGSRTFLGERAKFARLGVQLQGEKPAGVETGKKMTTDVSKTTVHHVPTQILSRAKGKASLSGAERGQRSQRRYWDRQLRNRTLEWWTDNCEGPLLVVEKEIDALLGVPIRLQALTRQISMIPVARGEEGAEHQQTLGEYVCPTLGAGGSPHERQCAQSMEASDMLQAARGLDGCITHDGQTRPVGSSNSVDGSGDFWRHPMSTRQPPRRTILQCSFRRCWSRNFESLPWIGRIWMLWRSDRVLVDLLESTEQEIHALVKLGVIQVGLIGAGPYQTTGPNKSPDLLVRMRDRLASATLLPSRGVQVQPICVVWNGAPETLNFMPLDAPPTLLARFIFMSAGLPLLRGSYVPPLKRFDQRISTVRPISVQTNSLVQAEDLSIYSIAPMSLGLDVIKRQNGISMPRVVKSVP